MKKLLLFILINLTYNTETISQKINVSDWGVKIGVSVNIGTHFNRIGFMAQTYYYNSFVQGNLGFQSYYNLRTLGPKITSWELVPNIGAHFYWDSKNANYYNPEFSTISIQTSSPYSIGYAFKYYLDTKGTSQAVGLFVLNIKNLVFATENDIFVFKGDDKYRTASFTLQYHKNDFSVFVTSLMWTGGRQKTKLISSSNYPSVFGYLDISECKYGNISHGILSFGAKYSFSNSLPFSQTIQSEIGIDSEYIRHFFQNKLIHDMPVFPRKWNKAENPHYPMLKDDGSIYLFGKNEKVKKTRTYFQIGANQPIFY